MSAVDPQNVPGETQSAVSASIPSEPTARQISDALVLASLGYTPPGADAVAPRVAEVVYLGNGAPLDQKHQYDDEGNRVGTIGVPAKVNQSVTRVEFNPDSVDPDFVENTLSTENDRFLSMIGRELEAADPALKKWAVAVSEIESLWATHSAAPKPAWVDSPNAELARAIAEHFKCPVGQPTALLTTGGRDALHAQNYSTSAPPATFNYMAITADATAPAAGDTVLTSEQTTNGLARAQATYAHTAGTNTTTLTKTFTYTGSSSVTLAKIGIFNASSSGTMGYETLLNATATVTTNGDNVTVTETITEG